MFTRGKVKKNKGFMKSLLEWGLQQYTYKQLKLETLKRSTSQTHNKPAIFNSVGDGW